MTAFTFPALTSEELKELKEYAEKHGKNWKEKLQEAWANGLPVKGFPSLYPLRNTHGSMWLTDYDKAPKAAPFFSKGERVVARKLIRAIRTRGFKIRHSDGWEDTECGDKKEAEIMALLSQTGQDNLVVLDADNNRVGCFILIGQGPEADGEELISDYSWRGQEEGCANEVTMNQIWNEVVNSKIFV